MNVAKEARGFLLATSVILGWQWFLNREWRDDDDWVDAVMQRMRKAERKASDG